MESLDKWWSSLKVTEKERIASKIARRAVGYPECTQVWYSLTEEKQIRIHSHCINKHDLFTPEEIEGKPFTD